MDTTEEVLKKIKELKKQLRSTWAEDVGKRMGKSKDAVYRYARGENIQSNKYHVDVLKHLIDLVEEENKRITGMLNK